MKPAASSRTALAILACAALAACVAPVGPVEVTRFHDTARLSSLGHGTISVEAAPGQDADSLELRTYQAAVAHQLQVAGYSTVPQGGDQVAEVRFARSTLQPGRKDSPVSVGVGGSTGSYGSGLGVGIGFNLSGKPKEQVTTQLGVMIRDRASNKTLWEGRANFSVALDSPMAETQLGAAKLAEALFTGFPGGNGETIEVK